MQFNLNESDRQCQHDRSGTLCGQCQPGLSVQLGSNRCAKCSSIPAIYIVPIFLVSGIMLVVLLFPLNLTVTVGSINGIIFYVNIVQLNSSVFFSEGSIFIRIINNNILE